MLASSPRGVRVVEVPPQGAARKAGLEEGDYILAIDGKAVAGLSGTKLHDLLSGEVGSQVVLRVDRHGTISELRIERVPYEGSAR